MVFVCVEFLYVFVGVRGVVVCDLYWLVDVWCVWCVGCGVFVYFVWDYCDYGFVLGLCDLG